ncbi:MAG TPA: M14 metallopeptidase family protein [Longimicrobiales bacterium]|nr:M14 metallopeptidase family protein [Longimicrobiales bacterium]
MVKHALRPLLALALAATLATPAWAQHRVTTPEQHFGHQIGADYVLPTYTQLHQYFVKVSDESDRMLLDTIGMTSEGRPQIMGIISSPENLRNLDRYKEIARRLAKAEGVTPAEAQRLSQEGKAVIWIDGGLHATEVVGANQVIELVYRMNDQTDPETLRILNDVILLVVHDNPDGMDLVANWYMREPEPTKRSTGNLPVLYHKYVGHDNNRDSYMSALAETTNMLRVQSREWFPQVVYNHHQTGPAGAIIFVPPFRDPPNHYLDPLIITGIDQIGSAMHQRFVKNGQGGSAMRGAASYSTWWNGGVRTTPYYKNQIGLLTEIIGNPTPETVPFIPRMQITRADIPLPVEPGVWHFRQSIEYSMTANFAVLDYASRNRDHLLYNIWRMGTNSIERGSKDFWTIMPEETEAAAKVTQRGTRDDYVRLLKDPANRDPRGFVIPSDQKDFLTATKFVNTLIKNGVDVHVATAAFQAGGKSYPAGSYVVKTAQAFRPHVMDMFEKQNHPNDFAYPGGPPIPPYDVTGWTLAWQMGVKFDRILDGFTGPFQLFAGDLLAPPAGTITGAAGARGYLVDHINDAFVAVNRVLKKGGKAAWYTDAVTAEGKTFEPGAIYLETDRATVDALAKDKGLSFVGVARAPQGTSMPLRKVKIALWDRYGGSMPSGWTRKLLEDWEFDFEVLYPPDFDTKDLSKYNVLLFEDGAIPPVGPAPAAQGGGQRGPALDPAAIPLEFRGRIGNITAETTIPRILDFARKGGTIITIGSSANLAYHAGLPVTDHLVANGQPLTRQQLFIPGTILTVKVEHSTPVTHGLGARADVMYDESPVFKLNPGAEAQGVKKIAWFDSPAPLRSGWAWGQEYLNQGVAALEADLGKGKLFIYGTPITFRTQNQGVFPLLFNGIYYGTTTRRPAS